MVVLDNYGMLSNTANENHYLMPDPAANPPSLDAKTSPLALLAQTCSLIGADPSNTKPLLSAMDRAAAAAAASKKPPSSTGSNSSSVSGGGGNDRSSSANGHRQPSPAHSQPPPSSTPLYKSHHSSAAAAATTAIERRSPESRLAYKPYEMNVLTSTRKSDRPSSGHTSEALVVSDHDRKSSSSSSRASSRKSASASPPSHHHHHHHHNNTVSPQRDSTAKLSTSPATATPATDSSCKPQTPLEASTPTPSKSSAAEALYSGLKESAAAASFKSPYSISPLANYSNCNGCPTTLPPGFDPTNPAFRNAYANGAAAAAAHLPHPALLDAACFQSTTPNPYLSYTRVKTPTGSEAVVPVCKDPYCMSCRFTTLHGVGPCPPGCVQCEPKYAAAAMLMSPFAGYQYGRPYVCNWVGVGGNEYCGKRFRNSDELLQHLRSHTSTSDPIALMNHLRYPSAAAAAAASSMSPLTVAAAAAAAARYHPYSKPGAHPASLAASPFSAFNPALAPFYPPYSLYDQRIGAAVNP